MYKFYLDGKTFDMKRVYPETIYEKTKASIGDIHIDDELMLPIISILNKKGYKTVFCCSGHFVKDEIDSEEPIANNCYIAFKNSAEELVNMGFIFPTPEFKVDTEDTGNYKCLIRKYYGSDEAEDIYLEILSTMIYLYRWANYLPQAKENNNESSIS